MFKFDDYPEIKEAYKESKRLSRISNRLIEKIRPDGTGQQEADEAFNISAEYDYDIFALRIFDVFNKEFKDKKPVLYNYINDRFDKWEDVFPEKWEDYNLNHKGRLLGLVMEVGYGVYWLPEEYYDDKPVDGYFNITCHTKPYEDE